MKQIFIKHTDWEGICFINNNKIYRKNILNENGDYIINNNKLTIKWKNWDSEDFILYKNIYYSINILFFDIEDNIYLFNKLNDKFNLGSYKVNNNNILMLFNNSKIKTFYTNKFNNYNKNIIIPINIDYIINVSLCKTNIIISLSPHISPDNIDIKIYNHNIINKTINKNNDYYEPSYTIIITLDNIYDNIYIYINNYEIYLEQLNIIKHNISAMTLFKDDYYLLEKYISYYTNLGVDIFYIYYNKKINNKIINFINNLNNINIYLIEWNYIYWNKSQQHNAQTMSINDSLHILRNYGNYILYNDLDEYIILNEYNNFNNMILKNINIDIYIFKNRFCKMGNELIKYEDFNNKFDLSIIIKGNYWSKYREKMLIKLHNINIMGIHKCFDININMKEICEFYHIINFEEKYREELMTEWIS